MSRLCLRGIDFGPVWGASGVQGFFGEKDEYRHHRFLRRCPGFSFSGMTFVAKTMTLEPRDGNLPLNERFRPREFFPPCIVVKFWRGVVLNAVGLSNPGARALLAAGKWQTRTEPFLLSFAAVGRTPGERLEELAGLVNILKSQQAKFRSPFGLQINFSCPNTEAGSADQGKGKLLEEVWESLTLASVLGVPLVPKLNVLAPPRLGVEIGRHPYCDALCVSNSLPWGAGPRWLKWPDLFGSNQSPLEARGFGPGALSGAPLLPLVAQWIAEAREAGLTIPINAGGGILAPDDAVLLRAVGADSVSLGSIALLRPWRLRRTIVSAWQSSVSAPL